MTQVCTANTLKTYPFTKCFSGWAGGEGAHFFNKKNLLFKIIFLCW